MGLILNKPASQVQCSSLFFVSSRPLNFVFTTENVITTETLWNLHVKSLIDSINHDVDFNARFSSARWCTCDYKKVSIPPLEIILSISSNNAIDLFFCDVIKKNYFFGEMANSKVNFFFCEMANSKVFLADMKSDRCSSTVEVRLR